jgi:pSer/pThr/pTyr-binding forkhead associated (FHA) protein
MPKLIFIGEKFRGRCYELLVERTTVGRAEINTLVIHDDSVSKAHCEILVNGPEVIVRDLGSSNGTFVNGVRLHKQQRQLKNGQLVGFGSVQARLEMEELSKFGHTTDVTAVHAHAKFASEEEQKPAAPSAARLQSDSDPRLIEQTVASTKPAVTPGPVAPEKTDSQTEEPSNRANILLVFAGVCGVAVLLWLLFGKK